VAEEGAGSERQWDEREQGKNLEAPDDTYAHAHACLQELEVAAAWFLERKRPGLVMDKTGRRTASPGEEEEITVCGLYYGMGRKAEEEK
jgi:hypothetical protein